LYNNGERGGKLVTILSVVILLGILIFVHEFGHFLAAKLAGVGVLKFSLGFGPRLIGKKVGETEYLISLIPLGGYIKLLGESEDEILPEEDIKRSFLAQSVWKRICIVAAGPAFNFLLAVVIFTFVNMWGLPVLITKIDSVQEGSAAFNAGIKRGDVITAIDGTQVKRWSDMAKLISNCGGRTLKINIKRENQVLNISVKPILSRAKNIFGEDVDSYKIGISPSSETMLERHNPFRAFLEGGKQTWVVSKLTLTSIVKILQGTVSPKTLGGPIMIAQLASAQVREGFIPFILFMALLSINLAVLNLLPIPILDGGHILFFLIEAIAGREINIKWRERAQQVGFALLILLMAFVLIIDLERMDLEIFKSLAKIFSK
jgi:regulator of sigma E protease